MEQKKVLWIFCILTAFLLIVFGVAWYLFNPSRNAAHVTKLDEELVTQPNLASIDADAWAKRETEVPSPQSAMPTTVTIDNNVTIVTGEGENRVDVSDLIDSSEKVEGELPASISNTVVANISSADSTDAKKDTQSAKENTASTSKPKTETSTTQKSATTSKTTTAKSTSSPQTNTTAPSSQILYWVQTASLTSRIYAEDARSRLQEKNLKAEIFTKETVQGLVHRVRVGPFENKTEANYWLSAIQKIDGFEGSFVSEEKL